MSPKPSTAAYQDAIRNLHGCAATYRETVRVVERWEGKTAWEGDVLVFDLQGHPTATRAYAWSALVDDEGKRDFYAVLHAGKVVSPETAVRAAIVQQHRERPR